MSPVVSVALRRRAAMSRMQVEKCSRPQEMECVEWMEEVREKTVMQVLKSSYDGGRARRVQGPVLLPNLLKSSVVMVPTSRISTFLRGSNGPLPLVGLIGPNLSNQQIISFTA
jgi:hypothetical protein